jgi:hypothetical protein
VGYLRRQQQQQQQQLKINVFSNKIFYRQRTIEKKKEKERNKERERERERGYYNAL